MPCFGGIFFVWGHPSSMGVLWHLMHQDATSWPFQGLDPSAPAGAVFSNELVF